MRRLLIVVVSVAVALILGVVLNTVLEITGVATPRDTVEARRAALEPHLRWHWPDGEGPYPALLLFSGCDGPQDNMETWAAMARARGWAAVVVDSHRPRGLETDPLWRLVCTGQALSGAERAGDVAVAMEIARQEPGVDGSRLVLLGASHGGWSVLELLGFHARNRRPDGLDRWPGGSVDTALAGMSGAILLYPYCGAGSRIGASGWRSPAPVLMMLVEDDAIADPAPCLDLARKMQSQGHPVTVTTFTGVTHGFDQRNRAPLSALVFDPKGTARALEAGARFLDALR